MKISSSLSLFIIPIVLLLFILTTVNISTAETVKEFGEINTAGDVYSRSLDNDWGLLKGKAALVEETDIRTGAEGAAYIHFIDGSMIDLAGETDVEIKGSPLSYYVQIKKGAFAFNIDPASSLMIATHSASVSIGGKEHIGIITNSDMPKRYLGVVSADGYTTEVKSVSGRLPVTVEDDTKIIEPFERVSVDKRGKFGVVPVDSQNLFIGSDADSSGFSLDKDNGSERAHVAIISSLNIDPAKGSVSLFRQGNKDSVRLGRGIIHGDIVETGEASIAKLSFSDGLLITVNEFSRLTIKEYYLTNNVKRGSAVLLLDEGRMRAVVGKNDLSIYTPSGVAYADGTVIVLEVIDGKSRLYVVEDDATFTFLTPAGLSEIIHTVDEGYMFGDGLTDPIPIPPYKLLEQFEALKSLECSECEMLSDLGVCIPDDSVDPGICKKCIGGNRVSDDTEDAGPCLKCSGGEVITAAEDPGICVRCQNGVVMENNTEDPGTCMKCRDGLPVINDHERPGDCQKCENGQVVPDPKGRGCPDIECNACEVVSEAGECVPANDRDPGLCLKCEEGLPVADNMEDPGICQKCEGGSIVADNSDDPGICLKCDGVMSVPDDLENPGICRKCEGGSIVNDNVDDPGICQSCEGGSPVSDDFEDPGLCLKCEGGTQAADDSEDPGVCLKCESGVPLSANFEDPGLCLKCEGGIAVSDNFEDPGICYQCLGGVSVVDNSEPCNDYDACTINDRCFGGICEGVEDPSPVDPKCKLQ